MKVQLQEATVKARKIAVGSYNGKVKTSNVHYVLRPEINTANSLVDKIFHVTQYAPIQMQSVKFQSVEVKIKPYDTAQMDVRFIFFQVYHGDTICHIKSIPPHLLKRKKMNLLLIDEGIIIQPDTFYMGYGIMPKKVEEEFRYKVYSTTKGNKSFFLNNLESGVELQEAREFPFVFPFVIHYKTL